MKSSFFSVFCAAFIALAALSSPTLAGQKATPQKTAKACEAEWKANKAGYQARGITQKAYVEECRGGGAKAMKPAAPAAASKTARSAEKAPKKTTAAVKPAATKSTPEKAAPLKTVKACEDEWKASKAAYQAQGITQKTYVEDCRSGKAKAMKPAAASASKAADAAGKAPKKVPAAVKQAAASQKTIKACEDEWRANKAGNQAQGITLKAYVEECRSGGGTVLTKITPAPSAPSAAKSGQATASRSAQPAATSAPAARKSAVGPNQFTTEAEARMRCPTDTIVWVNLDSGIYHFAGNRNYGRTKQGAYMCETDTATPGYRASKNEKHP
jgi:hypothetical protein